jgi:hypothetical protein
MEMKIYLIQHKDGHRSRIKVPADWKVTFGPAAAGNHAGRDNRLQMPLALRFYEAQDKQRAIFTDVVSFRDLSISVEVEETKTQEKEGYVEYDGVRKRTTFQARTREWVNPDLETPDFPKLPSDSELFGEDDL